MKNVSPDIAKKIIEEMEEDADLDEYEGTITVHGNTHLTGGESEEKAHERINKAIKEKFPDALVRTRWTYLEELPYNEYGDDIE